MDVANGKQFYRLLMTINMTHMIIYHVNYLWSLCSSSTLDGCLSMIFVGFNNNEHVFTILTPHKINKKKGKQKKKEILITI